MRDLFYMALTNAAVVAVLAVPAYGISRWGKRPALAQSPLAVHPNQTGDASALASALPIGELGKGNGHGKSRGYGAAPRLAPVLDNGVANQSLPELPLDDILHLAPAPHSPIAETTLSAEPIEVEAAIEPIAPMQTAAAFPWERTLAICWLAGSGLVFGLAIWPWRPSPAVCSACNQCEPMCRNSRPI